APFVSSAACPECHGKRLQRASLAVTYHGLDIAEMSRLPLHRLAAALRPGADAWGHGDGTRGHPERAVAAKRIIDDIAGRVATVLDLGLGYLSLDRSTPTLSPGEL